VEAKTPGQHVLDRTQILFDGFRHGVHQLDAGSGQALTRPSQLLLAGNHVSEAVGRAQLADPLVVALGARDVVKKAVQQLDRRRVRETGFAGVD
jgi:hypothetical protein